MMEDLEYAKEELKRIDHLIYVTLKYTRTVDVFVSIIERMINAYNFIVEALLKKAEEEGHIFDLPDIPIRKAEKALELYDSKKIQTHLNHYLMLRKLVRAEHEKSSEFRRHVTMKAIVDEKEVIVNIDNITEDFHKLKTFLEFIIKTVLG